MFRRNRSDDDAEQLQAPRWSPETETAVLGALLIDESARAAAGAHINRSLFYREGNQRILDAMRRLDLRGDSVDAVTLADELRDAGDLDAAGGMPYLAELLDAVPSAAHIGSHINVLRKHARRRQLLEIGAAFMARAAGDAEVAALAMEMSERLRAFQGTDARELPWSTLGELLNDPSLLELPPVIAPRLAWQGLVTLLAGREKGGKTTLADANGSAVSRGGLWLGEATRRGRVLVFNLEDPPSVRIQRLQAMGADNERTLIVHRVQGVEDLAGICARAEPDLVIVDTLPALVEGLSLDPGNAYAWTPVMRTLVRVTRDVGFALQLLHHANRSDGSYRDSTAIGANVDVILEMREDGSDPSVRRIKARGRVPVSDFAVRFHDGDRPYFSLADGKLSLETRVYSYIDQNPGASRTRIRQDVEGRHKDIGDCIDRLARACEVENRGSDSSSAYHVTRSPASSAGTGAERAGTTFRNGSPESGASEVPEGGSPPRRGGAPGNRPPADRDNWPPTLRAAVHHLDLEPMDS